MKTMTNEQKEFLMTLMENKENLEELFKIASMKQTSGKDLHIKDSIEVAGIIYSKFAEDENGNAFMLADECIYNGAFGRTNDWRESPIRKKLNDDMYRKIVSELGEDAIIPITVDLFSHDGLRDYGTCEDMVSILTYDLYRINRENIKDCKELFWTCTPDSTPSGCGAGCVLCVNSRGGGDYSRFDWGNGAVRPFFILKA